MPGKIQHILCTGNLCLRETHDYLKNIASDVHIVRGDFDTVGGARARAACLVRYSHVLWDNSTYLPLLDVDILGIL